MNYNPLKGYNKKLTIIPSFQATIIINNWMSYLTEHKSNYYLSNDTPKFILQSINDIKLFMSINKEENNTIIFVWCPHVNSSKNNIAYVIIGKIVNDKLQIHRIAQSPYYNNILLINSKDLVHDIKNIVKLSPNINNITYDELHIYDTRYLLSWTK